MPRLEEVRGYDGWKRNESRKVQNEVQRKEVAEFTLRAYEGDYDAVYLTEVNRSIKGDPLSEEFVTKIIPSYRYGQATERNLLRTRQIFSNSNEILTDPEFAVAKMVHALHFYSPDHPNRRNVESDNMRATFEFAKRYGNKPIVHLRSVHSPVAKASALEKFQQKSFRVYLKILLLTRECPY